MRRIINNMISYVPKKNKIYIYVRENQVRSFKHGLTRDNRHSVPMLSQLQVI